MAAWGWASRRTEWLLLLAGAAREARGAGGGARWSSDCTNGDELTRDAAVEDTPDLVRACTSPSCVRGVTIDDITTRYETGNISPTRARNNPICGPDFRKFFSEIWGIGRARSGARAKFECQAVPVALNICEQTRENKALLSLSSNLLSLGRIVVLLHNLATAMAHLLASHITALLRIGARGEGAATNSHTVPRTLCCARCDSPVGAQPGPSKCECV